MDPVFIKNGILAVLAAIGTAIAQALGGWDGAIIALIFFMAVDYITGLMVALFWHNSPKTTSGGASSAAGLKGLIRKIAMLILVAAAYMLGKVTGADYIRTLVIMFFIANEFLSILENVGLMGIKYPKFLKNALEVLRDQSDAGTVTDTANKILNTVDATMDSAETKIITDNQNEKATEKPPDAANGAGVK